MAFAKVAAGAPAPRGGAMTVENYPDDEAQALAEFGGYR
jgi:hypothetical protein